VQVVLMKTFRCMIYLPDGATCTPGRLKMTVSQTNEQTDEAESKINCEGVFMKGASLFKKCPLRLVGVYVTPPTLPFPVLACVSSHPLFVSHS
jgi:hypothetical protein